MEFSEVVRRRRMIRHYTDRPLDEETVERVLASGGSIAVPKMPIPGIGWLVYCKDTEGHSFGMMQNDPGAQ